MSLFSSLAIYFVIWWLVLFVVLPFGVRSGDETEVRVAGSDPGAPLQPLLFKKALATTVLASVLFVPVYLYFGVYDKSLNDLLPLLP